MNPVNVVGISRNVSAYHKGHQGKASISNNKFV